VNLLPGFVSPADLRHLKELLRDFGLPGCLLPDYSDTLDGPALNEVPVIPEGGTPLEAIRGMGGARATLEFGRTLADGKTAGALLAERFDVPLRRLGTPIGLRESDRLFDALAGLSGRPVPREHALERGRLVDAYVDGHKYVFGKRAVVYGEEDLVVGLTAFLAETGVHPVLCAYEIAEELETLEPDLLIGHSKGYHLARGRELPFLRVGFPLHDRFGGQRLLHLGYRGTLGLYDNLVNALLEAKQEGSKVGYGYL
jgi:nitrogenase molybdenum-iron protein NifN